mmetsp:Transcript_113361/g.219568  ORF Transcript_113361/g.219568 Transcript_113361/m.219568 type:complete len:278 (+) Transcript_113361:90-923(+)
MDTSLLGPEGFFRRQHEDPANRVCCDCGTAEPGWASVSHGIYLSIEASGVHRSLGVGVSFVQSTSLDAWKPLHLRMMELGGNRRFQDFLCEHGISEDTPIREKYSTRAAEWYRRNLRALAEGSPPPPPLLPGTGRLPARACDDPEARLLDIVFREVSPADRPTNWRGGAHRRHSSSDSPAQRCAVINASRCLAAAAGLLVAAVTNGGAGGTPASTNNSIPGAALPDWMSEAMLSEGQRTADRLRLCSSGTMEGLGVFGCASSPPCNLARPEVGSSTL